MRSSDGKMRLPEPLRPHSPLLHPKVNYSKLHSVLLTSDT